MGAGGIAPAPSGYGPVVFFEIFRGGGGKSTSWGAAPSAPPLATTQLLQCVVGVVYIIA